MDACSCWTDQQSVMTNPIQPVMGLQLSSPRFSLPAAESWESFVKAPLNFCPKTTLSAWDVDGELWSLKQGKATIYCTSFFSRTPELQRPTSTLSKR